MSEGEHESLALGLVEMGPTAYFDVADNSTCFWRLPSDSTEPGLITHNLCLLPDPPGSCWQVQFHRNWTDVTIAADEIGETSVSCERGIMIGGGCTSERRYPIVTRSGLADPESWPASTWQCSWWNKSSRDVKAYAIAYCLEGTTRADAVECSCCDQSFEDMFTMAQQSTTLGPGLQTVPASCEDEEDTLLLGNCMLDGEFDPNMANIALYRSGFPYSLERYTDEDYRTWQCSWNNPTELRPTATATAICLNGGGQQQETKTNTRSRWSGGRATRRTPMMPD